MSGVFKRLCESFGLVLAYCTLLITLYTMYAVQLDIPAPNRVTISFLCFISIFVVTALNQKLGIIALLFILPLLPNVTMQIVAFTGYGNILAQQTPGLDAVAGLLLGTIANRLWSRKQKGVIANMPWQAGLLMCVITASACLAITRNLYQSSSDWDLSILIFNIIHVRSLGWHHDYRPLVDWVAYGNAFALIALLVPALKTMPNRNDVVFKPLCCGVVVAVIVGLIQSQTGKGLGPLQVFFRNDGLGFIALGFQPDIHAFAGQMLIGAIGTLGYLMYSQSRLTKLSLVWCVMPLAWLGLVLSKSKASLSLAAVTFLIFVLIWTFRHSSLLRKSLLSVAVGLALFCLSFYFFHTFWVNIFISLIHRLGIADLGAANHLMAYRPEIFMAGLRMFAEYPLMGLGQGDFYRLSSNFGFSQSEFLTSHVNGENAHNYFLQVLTETGLIGFFVFMLLLSYPIIYAKNKVFLIPGVVGLASVCLGNIYSHSLLVRENLFVAAAFIALLYAWLALEKGGNLKDIGYVSPNKNRLRYFMLFVITIVLAFAVKEIYQSFKRFPFIPDNQCFINKPLTADGWTTGIYEQRIPEYAQGVSVKIKSAPPDVMNNPLKMTLSLTHNIGGGMVMKEMVLRDVGPKSIDLILPDNVRNYDGFFKLILKVNRCDYSETKDLPTDHRARGVQIESVEMLR